MRSVSSVLFLLACLMLTAHCALVREVPSEAPVAISHGPWTVDGVTLGASEAECSTLLGENFESLSARGGLRSLRWNRLGETLVTFDSAGRAREVHGASLLDHAGRAVLRVGSPLEHAHAALPHATVERHTRPSGSGVISLSRTLVGSSLTWADGASAFSIGFDAHGRATYVHVEPVK